MREFLEDLGEGNDPVRQTQKAMRKQLPRRFYKTVTVAPSPGGFGVLLDGKPVRTPARQLLVMPTHAAAALIGQEFEGQATGINPALMPVTRLANTVIDAIASDSQAVLEDLMRFAASDLLCYRATAPRELVERQVLLWDPVIDWLRNSHGANFVLAEGVIHVAQPQSALVLFGAMLQSHAEPFRLGCLHMFATLTGSAMLAVAIAEGFLSPDQAWTAGCLDEDWNASHWGEEAEAGARRHNRGCEMSAAGNLLDALSATS